MVTVHPESGLHARPATLLVKAAKQFNCKITIKKDDRIGNAKSILGILSVAVDQGDIIEVITEGEDEKKAMEAICYLFNETFKRI